MTAPDVLLHATYHGGPVTVTHATPEEIDTLSGPIGPAHDMLELWSLIAIRFGFVAEIHAIGWRALLANTYITSPLASVNLTLGAVRTRSSKVYLLGSQDQTELDPDLRRHLVYALETWGFNDVRSS